MKPFKGERGKGKGNRGNNGRKEKQGQGDIETGKRRSEQNSARKQKS